MIDKYFTILLLLPGLAQACCLWDSTDDRWYCDFTEQQTPAYEQIIRCNPPTAFTYRSGSGRAFCGPEKEPCKTETGKTSSGKSNWLWRTSAIVAGSGVAMDVASSLGATRAHPSLSVTRWAFRPAWPIVTRWNGCWSAGFAVARDAYTSATLG